MSITVNRYLTEVQYKSIVEYPFCTAIGTTMASSSTDDANKVWEQIKKPEKETCWLFRGGIKEH